jgi:hypothetical protein
LQNEALCLKQEKFNESKGNHSKNYEKDFQEVTQIIDSLNETLAKINRSKSRNF